jgi:Cu2+-exporting ATPase
VAELPGAGLSAGATRLGSARFCGLPDAGAEGLWLARPDRLPVLFRFADRLRPESAAAIAELRRMGLTVELLSGDAAGPVGAAAAASGIPHWTAGADPAAKAARIGALKAAGHRPLMVGDGINDATALALAHASAAPDTGSGLAQAAADLVLRGSPVGCLPAVLRAARRARRLARQNLVMSLVYNLVAVPVAVAGLATPLLAGAVMATSSLIVILNALRAESDAPAPGDQAGAPAPGDQGGAPAPGATPAGPPPENDRWSR